MIESGHGGVLLIYQNHVFRKRNQFKQKVSYWHCTTPQCHVKGNLYHISGIFKLSEDEHNHPSKEEYIATRKRYTQLARMAKTTDHPPNVLVADLDSSEQERMIRYVKSCRGRMDKPKKLEVKPRDSSKKKQTIQVGSDYDVVFSPQKKKTFILYDGFRFRLDKQCKNKQATFYWRCVNRDCRARAKINEDSSMEVLNAEHTHEPEAKALRAKGQRSLLKEAAMDVTRPLIEIYAEFEVKDLQTKRFLRTVRNVALENEPEHIIEPVNETPATTEETQQEMSLPIDVCDLPTHSAFDITSHVPPTSIHIDQSHSFDPILTPDLPIVGVPASELNEVYSIEEFLSKMDDSLL